MVSWNTGWCRTAVCKHAAHAAAPNMPKIVAAGAVKLLVALLSEQHSVGVQEKATGVLWNLALTGKRACDNYCASLHTRRRRAADANTVAIVDAGALPLLVALLASPSVGIQEKSAGSLWNLALNGATRAALQKT